MSTSVWLKWRTQLVVALSLALVLLVAVSTLASANVSLLKLSTDPYTNSTSQHQTEVEPDSYSFGSTLVSAIQAGRFNTGGSSNIAYATSTNNGASFSNGTLPGTTVFASPAGPYDRVTDPSVAYDAAHQVWLINSLGLVGSSSVIGQAVIVNRSTDGGLTFQNPVVVANASGNQNFDKNWIVCDDTASSPFYGHCYAEWDDNGNGNLILMSTSTDGGQTWGAPQHTANNATGIGGQPLVQPSGVVIVPIDNANETALLSFISTNGGASWGSTVTVTTIRAHTEAGGLRSGPLPTAEIDGAGTVYVVWGDCRFERHCSANDLVMTTTTNGTSYSSVVRIPADAVGSGVDHFLPGLAVNKATSGSSAHLGLAFYYYPVANCNASTCQLDVGFVSSTNGGSSWSAKTQLAGPMSLSWLPSTTQGVMVGDYISTSYDANGLAHPFFALANAPSGGLFDEALYTPASGLAAVGGHLRAAGSELMVSALPAAGVAPALSR